MPSTVICGASVCRSQRPPPRRRSRRGPDRAYGPAGPDRLSHPRQLTAVRELLVAHESPGSKVLNSLGPLRDLLDNGFTTIRDLGAIDSEFISVDLKRAVDAGKIVGPRMLVAPHLLSATGGHGDVTPMMEHLLAADCQLLHFETMDGTQEIIRAVREESRGGADWVKFAASGGFSSPADDPTQISFS